MKPKFYLGAVIILIGTQIIYSCKKEKSCEECNVNNKPPIAIAGPDKVISLPTDSVSLDGRSSSDPDGSISSFSWVKISGPSSFFIIGASTPTPTINSLVAGIYQFELKVTDNKGVPARDTVQVVVNDLTVPTPPTNQPPVAHAGPDQIIMLPANTASLDGRASTDPDNNISSYLWRKITGPSPFHISNINAVQTSVSELVQGEYQFELTVTDAGGLLSMDTVRVIVMNQLPPCRDCKIVFVSERDGNSEIYVCNADGSNVTRLTYDGGIDDQPVWSPDGTRIAFTSNRTGNSEVYIMNADGSNIIQKTFSSNFAQDPTWSPDGTKIAYSAVNNGSDNIWVVSSTTGSPSLLFEQPGWEGYPSWSPDGTKIALVSDWRAYDFVFDVYTINADGTGFTALTGNIFDQYDYVYPSWSPNNQKLAVTLVKTIGLDQYQSQIGIMNADGSGVSAITPIAAPWSRTSWSPDGSKIIYTSLSGTRKDISWVSPDGIDSGTIVTNGWNAHWQH